MKLSAPIYRLKRDAHRLARTERLPLHAALDRVALREGVASWSLLAARHAAASPAAVVAERLGGGDMLLLGARPQQGKVAFALEVAVAAMRRGRRAVFFSLEATGQEIRSRLADCGGDDDLLRRFFTFDGDAAFGADHIVRRLAGAAAGTVAIIDYLQLLDQRRDQPPLGEQIPLLRAFAARRGVAFVFISQIDRTYDPAVKPMPDRADVRLPNPLDLGHFGMSCFLNDGRIAFEAAETA